MFSKITLLQTVLLSVFALSVFTGCDSKVGEEPPPPSSYELGTTQCLTKVPPIIEKFVAGEAKDPDLESGWDCITSAVETFKRYVRGSSADRYTSQELSTFLEKNFLDPKGDKVSPELQTEFMKVKQLFVGGDRTYITRTELDKLSELFKNLRGMTLSLNPYMKVLAMKWSVSEATNLQADVRYFEDTNKEIQNAARLLASLIEKNGQSYQLSDAVILMQELGKFLHQDWDFTKTLTRYMPVVKKVKKALAGGNENSIIPNEWRRFALLGSRGYIQYLRYYYFIKTVPETGSGYRLSYLARTVEDVLSVFQDLVAEKPEGVVSRDEVTDLLKTLEVVWPEFKVSNNLVFESMKIKQLFFGGSVDSFTTTDFETARLKVSRIKVLIERFLPYYSIYGREWQPEIYEPDEAQKLFMESQFVLEATVREAGVLFEGAYDLNDLALLMKEVETLYPPKQGEKNWTEEVRKYLPLVIDTKNMILGGTDSSLRQGNWSVLLGFAARFYSDFLYYDYFMKDQEFEKPLIVGYWSVFANQSLNIFRDLLTTKKENQFSRKELNKLGQHLIKLEILPKALKADSLDQLLGVVLNNVLVSPERRLSGVVPNALTLSSVEVVRQEAQVWLDTELFIARLTENWKQDDGLKAKELINVLQKAAKDQKSSDLLKVGLRELLLSVNSPVPLTVDSKGRVIISNKFEQEYTYKSLNQLNLNRALTRVMLRSFVTDADRLKNYSGANLKEVENAFVQLKPIVVEMGLIESSNTTFASSRFREANIFVPHSDGSNLASFAEITDLVGMIFSGIRVDSMLRKDLVRVCFNGGKVTNDSTVSLSCARAAYKDSMRTSMTATPEYLKFMASSSKDEWALYMNNIFKAAGYVPNDRNMARVADISLAPHVIQYIEMLYARFDKNKDNYLSTDEAIKAFPAFKGILLELAKGQVKEEQLLDLFTYILRYGKPPETLTEKLRFVFKWRGKPENWDVWADRLQLSEILGYIADQVSKNAAKGTAIIPNPEPSEYPDGPQ